MGNTSSLNCCVDNNTEPQQLASMVPSKILIVQAYQEKEITPIKHMICRTSLLSELDFYLSKLRNSKPYSHDFMGGFSTFEELLELINYEDNQNWDIPIQTKTYNLTDNRFDSLNNKTRQSEFGILMFNKQNEYTSNLQRSNLKKIQLLLLQKPFKEYQQDAYARILLQSLKEWQGLDNYVWVIQECNNYADMTRKLIYHLSRYISFINSELSISDVVSLKRLRYLYHYILNLVASQQHQLLHHQYSLDNWVHQAEAHLLKTGQIIALHTFAQFRPFLEDETYEDDMVRLNPPKGDEEVPKIKVRLIVQPLKASKLGIKFRYFQYLFYLPFSIFMLQKIQERHGQLYLYLKQLQSQKIIQYIATTTKQPSLKPSKQDILNDLSQFRNQYAKELQDLQGTNSLSQPYYQRYIKNRVNVIISEEEIPILSKRELQICDDQVKLKLEEAATPHLQVDSQIQQVTSSPQQIAVFRKELDRYIKDKNFQKLQSQIDNVYSFINLTSLNISQCWLERLQCLHCFPNLVELFAYSNLIKRIEGLKNNRNLRILSLARNDIGIVQNIEHLTHLRELYLTKNNLDLSSANYLASLPLDKLKVLSISFKSQPDECFEVLMRKAPPFLKRIVINEWEVLTNRAKNTLKRRLKGVQIISIHG